MHINSNKKFNKVLLILLMFAMVACGQMNPNTPSVTETYINASTPGVTATLTVSPTATITLPPTPEPLVFSEDELNAMAEEIKKDLPVLVNNSVSDYLPSNQPDKAGNIFIYKVNPNSEKIQDLTEKALFIILSGRTDLLDGIECPPYALVLDGDFDPTDSLDIYLGPNPILTKGVNQKLIDAGIMVSFSGTTMRPGVDKVSPRQIYGKDVNNDLYLYTNGVQDADSAFLTNFSKSFGITFGMTFDEWLSFSKITLHNESVTVMTVKPGIDSIPLNVDKNGNLGYNGVAISFYGKNEVNFQRIKNSLSLNIGGWYANLFLVNSLVNFQE